jgi:hypothetical protein
MYCPSTAHVRCRLRLFSTILTALFILMCLPAHADGEDGPLVLVSRDAARAVVVIPDTAYPIARHAAVELVTHVQQATGVELEIVEESAAPADPPGRIYIGATQQAGAEGIRTEDLVPEEAVVRRVGSSLFIVGQDGPGHPLDVYHTHSGTLWGVYEYLERELGVLWLWPGRLGTHVPAREELTVGALDWSVTPALARRYVRHHSRGLDDIDPPLNFTAAELAAYRSELAVFMRRHRMGRSPGFFEPSPRGDRPYIHAFENWWDAFGEEHPEWFQLVDGKRGPGGVNTIGRITMCVSNPTFHDQIIEFWQEIRATGQDHPFLRGSGPGHINICENDDVALCECEDCRAWDGDQPAMRDVPAMYRGAFTPVNASNRYARFAAEIHRRAAEIDPDVRIYAYAYLNYVAAPDPDIRLHPNIIIGFVPWLLGNPFSNRSSWPLSEAGWFPRGEELQEWIKEQYRGWAASGASLFYRPNWFLTGYTMPHIFIRQYAEKFAYMVEAGLMGTDIGGINQQWSTQGANLYGLLRLHTHPQRPIDEILSEYFAAFGPAAGHVQAYTQYWEEHTHRQFLEQRMTQPGYGYYYLRRLDMYNAFPPASFEPAEAILREALKAAAQSANPEYAARVRFLMDGLENARLGVEFAAVHNSDIHYLARAAELGKCPRQAVIEQMSRLRRRLVREQLYIADLTSCAAWAEIPTIRRAEPPPSPDEAPEALAARAPAFIQDSAAGHPAALEDQRALKLRGSQHLVFRSETEEEIQLRVVPRPQCALPVAYTVVTTRGQVVARGELPGPGTVSFQAAEQDTYHVLFNTRAIFSLEIPDVAHAIHARHRPDEGIYMFSQTRPLSFHVPAGVKQFELTLSANRPGRNAVAEVFDPHGRKVAEMRAEDQNHVVRQQISNESGEEGIWMISAPRAIEGRHFWDVHVHLGDELSGFATFGAGEMLRTGSKD